MRLRSFTKPYEMLPPVPEKEMLTHGFAYQRGAFLKDIALDEIGSTLAQEDTFVWVVLREPSAPFLKQIQKTFDLHELALEDAYLAHQRPKIESYGQSLFVVLHTIESIQGDLHMGEVHLFLGRRFLLSICHFTTIDTAQVRQRYEAVSQQQLARSPCLLLHIIMDIIVEHYQPVLYDWVDAVENLETQLFHNTLERRELEQLYTLRQKVQVMSSTVLPLLDVCDALMLSDYRRDLISQDMSLYFRNTHDHLSQIVRVTERLRESLLAAMQMNLSLVAAHQNEIVKSLAAWGGIVFVPTIVFSLYGMNFQYMPELQWRYGYPFSIVGSLLICAWLYRRFKKKDWL
jgi:magnesium transporter